MSWRDFIPQDRLDEFDNDTLPVVKDKLQAGLYSGRHKDHAEDYVAGREGDGSHELDRRGVTGSSTVNLLITRSATSVPKPHIVRWTHPRGQKRSAFHPKAVVEMLIFGVERDFRYRPKTDMGDLYYARRYAALLQGNYWLSMKSQNLYREKPTGTLNDHLESIHKKL